MHRYKCDFFGQFDKLSSIGKDIMDPTKNTDALLKISQKTKTDILLCAETVFIPPIEREDVVSIAQHLHRLNVSLARLPADICQKYSLLNELKNCIDLFSKVFKNRFNFDCVEFENEFFDLFFSFEKKSFKECLQNNIYTFDTKSLLKCFFFDKIKECFDNAANVADTIVASKIIIT